MNESTQARLTQEGDINNTHWRSSENFLKEVAFELFFK